MSNPVEAPPSCAKQVADLAFQTGAFAAVGTLAAVAFSVANPVGAAVFGATAGLTSGIVSIICEQAGWQDNGFIAKTLKVSLGLILGTLAGVAVATALGFPITFTAAAVLTAACVATALVGSLAIVSCLGIAVLGAAAIGFASNTREPNLESDEGNRRPATA